MVLIPALIAASIAAQPAPPTEPPPAPTTDAVDPLTARIDDSAAQRFAQLWRDTDGKPTADQIGERYLRDGGRGVEVFTPYRIRNAEHLAATVAKNPDLIATRSNAACRGWPIPMPNCAPAIWRCAACCPTGPCRKSR